MADPADERIHRITSLVEDTLFERGVSDQLLTLWRSKESHAFATLHNSLPAETSNAHDRQAALEVIHCVAAASQAPLEIFFDTILLYDMCHYHPPVTTLHRALSRALACYIFVVKRSGCPTPMPLATFLKYANLHSEMYWSITVDRDDVLTEERTLILELSSTPPSMLGWLTSFSTRLDAITYGRLQGTLDKIDELGASWALCLAWGRPSGQGGMCPRTAAIGVFALAVAAYKPMLVEQLASPEDHSESQMATMLAALADLHSLASRNASAGGSTSEHVPNSVLLLDRALTASFQAATLAEEACVQVSIVRVLEHLQAQPMLATHNRLDAPSPPAAEL